MAIDRDGLFKASLSRWSTRRGGQILNSVPGADNSGFEPILTIRPPPGSARSGYGGPERLPKILFVGISAPAIQTRRRFCRRTAQNLGDNRRQQGSRTPTPVRTRTSGAGSSATSLHVPDAVSTSPAALPLRPINAQNKLGGYKNEKVGFRSRRSRDQGGRRSRSHQARTGCPKAFRED